MTMFIHKTVIMIDERNYLIYLNHSLLLEKGTGYTREKKYLKKLVEEYWNIYHSNPDTLGDAESINIIKETFGLNNLEII